MYKRIKDDSYLIYDVILRSMRGERIALSVWRIVQNPVVEIRSRLVYLCASFKLLGS